MPEHPRFAQGGAGVALVRNAPRNCENCGGSNLESLWRYRHDARTHAGIFRFDVNNVICSRCGFVFVSPVYDELDLAAYYGASYGAYTGAELDYDIRKRLSFLTGLAGLGSVFVEIGANKATAFHDELRSLFDKVILVDPNDSVASDFKSLADLTTDSADVLAHYFVLEHVPSASKFFRDCSRVLKQGGIMICEVPDIEIYPIEPSALQLHEHTSHFSKRILKQIAAHEGFELICLDTNLCSRPFGFASAFCKTNKTTAGVQLSEYEENRARFLGGVTKLKGARVALAGYVERAQSYEALGQTVIFWAANAVMDDFLRQYSIGSNVTIVDNDPAKVDFFDGRKVLQPHDAAEAIRNAQAIFIFTDLHRATILQQIGNVFGKFFDPAEVHVVDVLGAEAGGRRDGIAL